MAVIDFSALSAYVDQISGKLIKKALLTDRTISTGITVQTGIKYQEAINILTVSLVGQATDCGLSPTGSVALSQRTIEVCPITVYEDICASKFDQYWTQILNPAGSYYDKNPIEQVYVDQKVNAIAKLSGELLWRGSKTGKNFVGTTNSTTTGNITLCNGILYDLERVSGSASVILTASASTAFSADPIGITNQIIQTAITSAPDMLVEPNKNVYMSYANFNSLRNALMLNSATYFQYNNANGEVDQYRMANFFGTGFDIIAVQGLNGASRIVCTFAKNIVYGVDLENDAEQFEVFYDRYRDLVLFRSKWKQGAKIAFPGQVVLHKGGTY